MASVFSIQMGRIARLGPGRVRSAIVKSTVSGIASAGILGLQGDEQADLTVHGGPDKAIYFYPSEHYPLWAVDVPQHARLLIPGAFGENVTTTGLDEEGISIGDVLAIGSTEMQVTQPRQPCFKLALRFDDSALGRIMMQTNRTGWYVRVVRTGELKAGDEIRVVRRPSPQWTIARFNNYIVRRRATVAEKKELSELEGLPEEWREKFSRSLQKGA